MTDQSLLDLFTKLDSREGLFLWMVMLISFLLGFLIAYLLRSGKIRRLKKELKGDDPQMQQLHAELASIKAKLQQRDLELQEESCQKVELMDRLVNADQKQQQHLQEVFQLNQRIEELQANTRTYTAANQDLQLQISALKTQNEELLAAPQNFADMPLAATNSQSEDVAQLRNRLNEFEVMLGRLSTENGQLRSDLQEIKSSTRSLDSSAVANDMAAELDEPEPRLQSEKTVLYEKIIVSDRPQDDLTQIEGIGEFLAKQLHSAGVFTYADIASWSPEQVEAITQSIAYIPGRIEKDGWVAQAAQLLAQQNSMEAATSSAAPTNKAADLKLIEGIGPKIEEVLKAAGIADWNDLSATEPGKLKEILEEAGDRFRMHNPYTWPLQARLAAAGRWDELKAYQDELKGGRDSA